LRHATTIDMDVTGPDEVLNVLTLVRLLYILMIRKKYGRINITGIHCIIYSFSHSYMA
jgi:hypothetical protein